MSDSPANTENTEANGAEDDGIDPIDKFAELPDAPPKKGLKLSWVGKLAVAIVSVWVFIAFFGPWIAPYHEAEFVVVNLRQ